MEEDGPQEGVSALIALARATLALDTSKARR